MLEWRLNQEWRRIGADTVYCTYAAIPYSKIFFFTFSANREMAERQVDEHSVIKKDPPENVVEIILPDDATNDLIKNDNSFTYTF